MIEVIVELREGKSRQEHNAEDWKSQYVEYGVIYLDPTCVCPETNLLAYSQPIAVINPGVVEYTGTTGYHQ